MSNILFNPKHEPYLLTFRDNVWGKIWQLPLIYLLLLIYFIYKLKALAWGIAIVCAVLIGFEMACNLIKYNVIKASEHYLTAIRSYWPFKVSRHFAVNEIQEIHVRWDSVRAGNVFVISIWLNSGKMTEIQHEFDQKKLWPLIEWMLDHKLDIIIFGGDIDYLLNNGWEKAEGKKNAFRKM